MINRSELAVKSLGDSRVGGYGILWGTETEKDLYGEFFTPKTAEILTIFEAMGKLPGLYDHAMNATMKSTVTGYIDTMKPDHRGVWVEEQLDQSQRYFDDIMFLIEQEKLYWSSGALPAAYTVSAKGHIKRWPVMEMTKTVSPAEWRMVFSPITQMNRNFSLIGIDLPSALKSSGLLLSESQSDGDEESREDKPQPETDFTIPLLQLDYELLMLDMEDLL